jgi:UDP:flavonoid glycosyltransferase YjiC (YdhE family)
MSRYLFVVPPLRGHIGPLAATAQRLNSRGHAVAWAAEPASLGEYADAATTVFSYAVPVRIAGATPSASDVRDRWENYIIPLAETMADGVERGIAGFCPDVVVGDRSALAAGLVADRLGVPWATSATSSGDFVEANVDTADDGAWIDTQVASLRARLGNPARRNDPRFSPHLILAYTTRALMGEMSRTLPQLRCVGPSLDETVGQVDFPWYWVDPGRALVVVTLGHRGKRNGARFLGEATRALLERRRFMQAIVVADEETLALPADAADHIMLRDRCPPRALLDQADALLCHGGHHTVCKSLWHGLPMVVAPMCGDEPVVARQVTEANAGIELPFEGSGALEIGHALDRIFAETCYRDAARRIGKTLRNAGGPTAAVRYLEDMTRKLVA